MTEARNHSGSGANDERAGTEHAYLLPRGVLLDIEGTTSSLHFVHDVMFPFVRRELAGYLRNHGSAPASLTACDQIAQDAGWPDFSTWQAAAPNEDRWQLLQDHVQALMDEDRKSTGLKALQGLIWQAGFDSGELKAHVYPEVADCLNAWHRAGHDLRIYSSGSIAAQRLFFGHTIQGNLLQLLSGHYDTTTGGKREKRSYEIIAEQFQLAAQDIAFVSDVIAELDAARDAGMLTFLSRRPENPPISETHDHREITSFAQLIPNESDHR